MKQLVVYAAAALVLAAIVVAPSKSATGDSAKEEILQLERERKQAIIERRLPVHACVCKAGRALADCGAANDVDSVREIAKRTG